jgi:lincosamide nucleotidyltransferase A/C/D/E
MGDADQVEGAERGGLLKTATGQLYGFLKSHRLLDSAAVWVSRRVREAPPSSLLNVVLGPLRARFRGEMTDRDVLDVVGALEGAGLHFWVAGGWGVDLLAGAQARRHDDLDIVLADYEADEPRALAALAPLGYRRVEVLDGLWMTPRSLVDDGAGHQIEVLGLDRARLDRALGPDDRSPAPSRIEDRSPELFTTGSLGGRRVPCLSVALQLLFHSGFDLRGVDGPDIARLRAMATDGSEGAVTTP